MSEPIIHLKPRKERPVLLGHPWIFSGAIAGVDAQLEPGSLVTVCAAGGEFLGRGYANPRCAIAVRLLTWTDEPIDAAFLRRRVGAAQALRRDIIPPETDAYRILQSGRSCEKGSTPHHSRGHPFRNETSPSWTSWSRSATGFQPWVRATLVRTSKSTPETKRYPPGLTTRAKLRRQLSAASGDMWQRNRFATTTS